MLKTALLIAAILFNAAQQPTQEPTKPTTEQSETRATGIELLEPGVYYKGPKDWIRLEQLSMAGGGAKHLAKVFVPGLTPQMVWTFRGAESPVQITERRPTIYVKQNPTLVNIPGRSSRDLIVIKFDKKKDHRELQTTSGGNMFTFKAGISKERMPEITIARVSDSVFSVTPSQDLQPGEYLVTFSSMGITGYDFGIAADKK